MQKPFDLRLFLFFGGLVVLVAGDAALLTYSFDKVVQQQASVKRSYSGIDQIAVVTTKLRDAEVDARRYVASGEGSIANLNADYDGVAEAMLIADDHIESDRVSTELSNQFIRLITTRKQNLSQSRSTSGRLSPAIIAKALAGGDAEYVELAMLLAKIKEIQESTLQKNLAPASTLSTWFFLAVFVTAILNLLVGAVASRQYRQAREKADEEKAEYDRHSSELNERAQAAAIVSGEIDIARFTSEVRSFLIKQFSAAAIKIYVGGVEDLRDADGEDSSTSIGNLVASAARAATPLTVNQVPAHYWTIGSGLGKSVPSQLLFLPLRFQSRLVGLVELAFLSNADATAVSRLGSLAEVFAVALNAAESRQRAARLLEQTLSQSAELLAQEEELRATNEELEQQARAMESQQESLQTKNTELETIRSELERKADDLQQSSKYKSDFLAKMSHELRTPLNGLLILSTLLIENKEGTLTDQQKKFAQSIQNAGNDLLTLINDILDLSKIEARKLTVHVTDFTLGDLFASKRRTFEPQTQAKNLELRLELPSELSELSLHTDRQRLDQVLRNFLSNAVKFTESGYVGLEAKLSTDGTLVTFIVTDTGRGIPRDRQQLIFEAFEQADTAISGQFGGTGLGLTISRELSLILGGEIGLESEEGRGSRFSLTIPLHLNTNTSDVPTPTVRSQPVKPAIKLPEAPDIKEHVQGEAKRALNGLREGEKTIMIVEDDDNFREGVVEAVKAHGFQVIEVRDGEVALAVLAQFTPDALLLDIKLPGISGLGILEVIKQMPHLRHVPVHMISGLDYQQNALRMGALGYLTKPVTLEKVKSAIERIENLLEQQIRDVLLIEDNERQNEAITALISAQDIHVTSVRTGRDAMDRVRNDIFDCIILDLTLPDVSGFDLLAELRALEISLPPVVIYTGRDLTDDEQDYLGRHSDSIVIKGARSPERLLDEVNLFLHRVESALPSSTRDMLSELRSRELKFEGKVGLVVDDDVRNIFALTSALESKGFKIRTARDGEECLRRVNEDPKIDVILMDVMMPKMDGFEATRRLRAHPDPKVRSVPIIALTAKAMREDQEACLEAGASDYLPKPVNLENLFTVLKVWVSEKGFGSKR